jgi:hypothetical protein
MAAASIAEKVIRLGRGKARRREQHNQEAREARNETRAIEFKGMIHRAKSGGLLLQNQAPDLCIGTGKLLGRTTWHCRHEG